MEILIVTPMREELAFFLQSCSARGLDSVSSDIGRLSVTQIPDLGATLAVGGTGKAQFALQIQHLLDSNSSCELVVCAGAAGALADDLSVGDVVVGTSTVEHDYNNRFNDKPVPTFAGAAGVISALRSVPIPSDSFKVHFGVVASGDEDVIDSERRAALRRSTDALAVAWEGAGGARACKFSDVAFVEIRGITDVADRNASSDFAANLELAMGNTATLLLSWIEKSGDSCS